MWSSSSTSAPAGRWRLGPGRAHSGPQSPPSSRSPVSSVSSSSITYRAAQSRVEWDESRRTFKRDSVITHLGAASASKFVSVSVPTPSVANEVPGIDRVNRQGVSAWARAGSGRTSGVVDAPDSPRVVREAFARVPNAEQTWPVGRSRQRQPTVEHHRARHHPVTPTGCRLQAAWSQHLASRAYETPLHGEQGPSVIDQPVAPGLSVVRHRPLRAHRPARSPDGTRRGHLLRHWSITGHPIRSVPNRGRIGVLNRLARSRYFSEVQV